MYESPIELLTQQAIRQINDKQDEAIYEAVTNIDVNVDKKELLRALRYDRGQYDKGYRDGYEAGQRSVTDAIT